MPLFSEIKRSFEIIVSDRAWFPKLVLAAVLLINPVVILAALNRNTAVMAWSMGFNAVTFWLPLGYTMEVLRRARRGTLAELGLPSWELKYWGVYVREGAVKFIIALFTLILPSGLWIVFCVIVFGVLGQQPLASMAIPFIFFFTIPFCAVGCCRWLDSGDVLGAALDYRANLELYRLRWSDYSVATMILMGLNTIGNSFVLTLPFVAVFGLCLVDTWFGPIYAASAKQSAQPAHNL